MIKKFLYTAIFISSFSSYCTQPTKKTPVCIDLTCFMETNATSAASCVGYFDAIGYFTATGHIPGIDNLFEALQDAPAQSTLVTYNQNYQMPLILSDWLLGAPNQLIKQNCFTCLEQNTTLKNIEKTVLKSIVDMMLTPKKLIETQSIISSTKKLIEDLYATGMHDIYLVGNWDADSTQALLAKISSLKMMHLFTGFIFSHDLKTLKPHAQFYTKMLAAVGCTNPSECICLEREPVMQEEAQRLGFAYIPFSSKASVMKSHASQLGIVI